MSEDSHTAGFQHGGWQIWRSAVEKRIKLLEAELEKMEDPERRAELLQAIREALDERYRVQQDTDHTLY